MTTVQIEIPPKLIPLFSHPNLRYKSSWGGRGSGKTRTFALMTAIKGYMFAEAGISGMILGAREFMNSLSDSSMEEIKQAISSVPFLNNYYEMGENYIRTKNRRVSYGFAGLRHNLDSIKSKARILLCWVDEAETVSEIAWRKLLPTVRENDSEVWVTWNPERRDSATSTRFRHEQIFDDSGKLIGMGVEMNYTDNPWFPDVLEIERRRDQANQDDATYRWIWEGDYLEMSEAQIFKNKYEVKEFTPDPEKWDGPYQGLDFGFANDPTAGTRSWIHDDCLYIEYEAGKVGLELDDTVDFLSAHIPDIEKYALYADNARPESISHLKRKGLPKIKACEKGKGSVEDGIAFIKSFRKVYIHPRCVQTLNEFRNYSYKKDRLTDEVLPIIVDAWNHYIDSCIEYGQLVTTQRGYVPIQDVTTSDFVLTRKGYKKVNKSWKTYESAEILCLKTSSGLILRGTKNHKVFTTNRGFVRMDALRYNDELVIHQDYSLWQAQKPQSMAATLGADTRVQKEEAIENILKGRLLMASPSICTGKYGKMLMAKFQKATTSIIKTEIAKIMLCQIWSCYHIKSILPNIFMSDCKMNLASKRNLSILKKSGRLQKHGTLPQKALLSIKRLAACLTKTLSQSPKTASNAIKNSNLELSEIEICSAQIPANQLGAEKMELMTSLDSAQCVPTTLLSINTVRPKLAVDRVQTVYATGERNKVYDLEVDGQHEFFASGVLVHNCRYALERAAAGKKRQAPATGGTRTF